MVALTRNPSNPNFLQPNKFILNFSRVPALRYFCQSVTVPGISTSEIPQPSPFVELYKPGEKPIYDILNVTFMVDEKLESWREIHDWIRAMTFPYSYQEYEKLKNLNPYAQRLPQYSDASLLLLSSSNNPILEFKFFDVFPISISSFVMSSSDSPDTIITADASFRYSLYDLVVPT